MPEPGLDPDAPDPLEVFEALAVSCACATCNGTGYAPGCTATDRERGDLWACSSCYGEGVVLELELEGCRHLPPGVAAAVREVAPALSAISDEELERACVEHVRGVFATPAELALALLEALSIALSCRP